MKQINNYIIEKLHLNKDIKTNKQVSEDFEKLISLIEKSTDKIKKVDIIYDWFIDNNIDTFNIYFTKYNMEQFKSETKYTSSNLTNNSPILEVSNDTYNKYCEAVVGKNIKNIDELKIYDASDYVSDPNLIGSNQLNIWGNKNGLIFQTFNYEFLLLKK
jgi:hypothetical protein